MTLLVVLGLSVLAVSATPVDITLGEVKEVKESRLSFLDTPKPTSDDASAQKAIDKGLAYLVSIQDAESGAWRGDVGLKYGGGLNAYTRDIRNVEHLGITALACMALVANGSTPRAGPYSHAVREGTKFILKSIKQGGQIVENKTRMYSNAFAMLYLAEVYGMYGGNDLKDGLTAAVGYIERNQNGEGKNKGGWRYVAKQNDADISVTVTLLQGLRAARNAGIRVHQETIDMARDYIVRTYRGGNGAFVYQPSKVFDRQSFALTAAGIVSLQSAGNYANFKWKGTTIHYGLSFNYLSAHRPDKTSSYPYYRCDFSFWYGHYYAAQAMRQRGITHPAEWERWNKLNRRHFQALQHDSGAWLDEIGEFKTNKAAYGTAMACLILGISNNYLPIFQH